MNQRLRGLVLAKAMGTNNAELARIANDAIEAAERVVETRASLEKRRQAALEAYREEVQAVDDLLESLQRHCGHPATTDMHGLPGERMTRCDLCDAEL